MSAGPTLSRPWDFTHHVTLHTEALACPARTLALLIQLVPILQTHQALLRFDTFVPAVPLPGRTSCHCRHCRDFCGTAADDVGAPPHPLGPSVTFSGPPGSPSQQPAAAGVLRSCEDYPGAPGASSAHRPGETWWLGVCVHWDNH